MLRYFAAVIIAALIFVTLYQHTTTAGPEAQPGLTKEDVQTIVKEYLLENPEVVIDSLEAYKEKQVKEADAKAKTTLKEMHAEIYEHPATPKFGNLEDPDVKIVEFFDYHCGYCKHMLPVISQLVEEDPGLQIILREFPIPSEDSARASRAGLAVYALAPDKYFDYHAALMKHKGQYSEKKLLEMAATLGIDKDKLKAEMEKPEIDEEIKRTRKITEGLNLTGTPAFIIGTEILPGAASLDSFKEAIKAAREAKKNDQ